MTLHLAKSVVKAGLQLSHITTTLVRRRGGAHVIMLHGVGNGEISAAEFRQLLVWLKKQFDVVSLDTVVDRLASNVGSIPHCTALTFDDGLRNNFTVAYPILQELEVPAAFFVCPDLIDAGQRLWTHEASYREAYLRQEKVDLEALLGRFGYRSGDVKNWMKGLELARRQEVEQVIAAASAAFVPTETQRRESELMSWDEIRRLDPELITIGSHSLTHPILTLVPDDVAEKEICGSAERLRAELGRPIDYFCFPNGDCNPRILEIVMRCYRAGIGTEFGINRPGMPLDSLLRVCVIPQLPDMAWNMYCASG